MSTSESAVNTPFSIREKRVPLGHNPMAHKVKQITWEMLFSCPLPLKQFRGSLTSTLQVPKTGQTNSESGWPGKTPSRVKWCVLQIQKYWHFHSRDLGLVQWVWNKSVNFCQRASRGLDVGKGGGEQPSGRVSPVICGERRNRREYIHIV